MLDLTELEVHPLAGLAQCPGHLLTFTDLLNSVWGDASYRSTDLVHSAVKRLRRKLAKASIDVHIDSVRGAGFRLRGSSA
ncbi:MAG: helix-turn-helix domain-containing protein [Actinomycetota bacterium]